MNHWPDDEGICRVDGEGWPCATERAWFDYKLAFNREFPDAGGPVLGHRAFMAGRASVEAERDALRAQLDKVRDALHQYREHTLPGVWLAMRLADVAEWEELA